MNLEFQKKELDIMENISIYSDKITVYEFDNFNFNFLGARQRKYFWDNGNDSLYKKYLENGIP